MGTYFGQIVYNKLKGMLLVFIIFLFTSVGYHVWSFSEKKYHQLDLKRSAIVDLDAGCLLSKDARCVKIIQLCLYIKNWHKIKNYRVTTTVGSEVVRCKLICKKLKKTKCWNLIDGECSLSGLVEKQVCVL